MRSLDSRWAHEKLAPVFPGWRIVLVTSWGSYDLAFETFIALYLIAIGVLVFLRLPAEAPGVV